MSPKSQIDPTVERFQSPTPERQETKAKLTTGSPLTANDPAGDDWVHRGQPVWTALVTLLILTVPALLLGAAS
jgi:hypothetical protein